MAEVMGGATAASSDLAGHLGRCELRYFGPRRRPADFQFCDALDSSGARQSGDSPVAAPLASAVVPDDERWVTMQQDLEAHRCGPDDTLASRFAAWSHRSQQPLGLRARLGSRSCGGKAFGHDLELPLGQELADQQQPPLRSGASERGDEEQESEAEHEPVTWRWWSSSPADAAAEPEPEDMPQSPKSDVIRAAELQLVPVQEDGSETSGQFADLPSARSRAEINSLWTSRRVDAEFVSEPSGRTLPDLVESSLTSRGSSMQEAAADEDNVDFLDTFAFYDAGHRANVERIAAALAESTLATRTMCHAFDQKAAGQEDLRLECPLCLAGFKDGEELRTLPCFHAYHRDCVDIWLKKYNLTCPVCRLQIQCCHQDLQCCQQEDHQTDNPVWSYRGLPPSSSRGELISTL